MSAPEIVSRAARARDWLMDAALPLWAQAGFDPQTGLFIEKLDLDGAPTAGPARMRVQSRQTYVFRQAGRLGWRGAWRPLVEAGLATLCGPARVAAESGAGVGAVFGEAGVLIDARRDLYDQAFALFALAQARDIDPARADLRIGEMLAYLETQRAPCGGFLEGEVKPAPRRQNPHMHLFEAGLALAEAGHGAGAALARDMAALFDRAFYDDENGALGEYYHPDWSRERGEAGRLAEPGHHCEWIWLLDRWRRHGGEDRSGAAAQLWARVQRDGLHGGVAIDEIWRDGGAKTRTARLWPQTERLKAALVRYEAGLGDSAAVAAAFDGLWLYFEGVRAGLWRDRRREDGSFVVEPSPASSFYHIMLAFTELLRVARV